MLTRSISLARAPAAAPGGMSPSSRASSSLVSLMLMALRFSSRCRRVLLLGMGMMSAPWASSQASASCAGVTDFLGQRFELGEQLQIVLEVARLKARMGAAAVAVGKVLQVVDRACEEASSQGREAMKPILNSRQACRLPPSGSRDQREYSICKETMGCIVCARRMEVALASESAM